MTHRILRRGLPGVALLAVVLVVAFGYANLRLGATPAVARFGAAHPVDTTGSVNFGASSFSPMWTLYAANPPGATSTSFLYGSTWDPIAGDWTGKGYDSPGMYNGLTGTFYLRNSNTAGDADIAFRYGPITGPGGGYCFPISGDWTGKGYDSVGVDCDGDIYLRNSNTGGNADIAFNFGPDVGCTSASCPGAECQPLAGDWTGKGYDSVGVYCTRFANQCLFFLQNSNSGGNADIAFNFGPANSCLDSALAGDWTGKGYDSVGLEAFQCPGCDLIMYLRNSNTSGPADIAFTANQFAEPIAGHWTPPAS